MRLFFEFKPIKVISSLMLIVFLVANPDFVKASVSTLDSVLSFEDLGADSDIILHGPYDARDFRFHIPPTTSVQDGYVNLVISTYETIGTSGSENNDINNLELLGDFSGAILDVYFNDHLQQSIPLKKGEDISYGIPISSTDLSPQSGAFPYKISFFLDATIDCDLLFHNTVVSIDSMSEFEFSFDENSVDLDLHLLPQPIYLENSNLTNLSYVVLPASPTAEEVRAGLTVMAAFGRKTFGYLPLSLVTEDQISENTLAESNLIYVGKPDSFTTLQNIDTPLNIKSDLFALPEIADTDGVLQLMLSPWNNEKYILLVSGELDEGVVKASQALSTWNIQTGLSDNYSIVESVNSLVESNLALDGIVQISSIDFTLDDINQDFSEVDDVGENYVDIEFAIPPDQIPTDKPYMELMYSFSPLVDVDRSGIVVYLNDVRVGGVKFLQGQTGNLIDKIELPVSAFVPGDNLLELVINLVPLDKCSAGSISSSSGFGVWTTIFPDTTIHLPLVSVTDSTIAVDRLSSFPSPFLNDSTFGSTAFVLPSNNPRTVGLAGNIAYELGRLVQGTILLPEAYFDSQLPENFGDKNLIIVGEPKKLQILNNMKDSLPGYFEEGSNIAVLESQQVTYRISDQKTLGYLELLSSPWNDKRAILGVFGTNDDGVEIAGSALSNLQLKETLLGNFAAIDGVNAIVVDTRTGQGVSRVVSELKAESISQDGNVPAMPNFQAEHELQQRIILYIVAFIVLLIFVMIIVALRIRKRS